MEDEELTPDERLIAEALREEGRRLRAQAADPEERERFWLELLQRWSRRSPQPVYACPKCYQPTAHPKDIAQGYCGLCHDWTGVRLMTMTDFERLLDASSLGTEQSRRIRAQCPPRVAEFFSINVQLQQDIDMVVRCMVEAPEPPKELVGDLRVQWYAQQLAGTFAVVAGTAHPAQGMRYWARVWDGALARMRKL